MITPEMQIFIQILTGGVAVKIANGLKKIINPTNVKIPWAITSTVTLYLDINLLIAIVVSFALAIAVMLVTSQFTGPLTTAAVADWFTMVFSVATVIYKSVVKEDTPTE